MFTWSPYELAILFGMIVVVAPAVLVVLLGLSGLLSRTLSERTISKAAQASIGYGLAAALAVLALMLLEGERHVVLTLGDWVELARFHVAVKFVFDRLSVPFAILTFILSGTIAAFATRYRHRERGFGLLPGGRKTTLGGVEHSAGAIRPTTLRDGRTQRSAGAGRGALALSHGVGHGPHEDSAVFALLVADFGGDSPGNF